MDEPQKPVLRRIATTRKASKLVSFRLDADAYERLAKSAKCCSMSPGGLAREAILERLAGGDSERRGAADLEKQLRDLREDVAMATEAILTMMGQEPITHEEAAAWVRQNLRR